MRVKKNTPLPPDLPAMHIRFLKSVEEPWKVLIPEQPSAGKSVFHRRMLDGLKRLDFAASLGREQELKALHDKQLEIIYAKMRDDYPDANLLWP